MTANSWSIVAGVMGEEGKVCLLVRGGLREGCVEGWKYKARGREHSEERTLTKARGELECGCYKQCGDPQNGSLYLYPTI